MMRHLAVFAHALALACACACVAACSATGSGADSSAGGPSVPPAAPPDSSGGGSSSGSFGSSGASSGSSGAPAPCTGLACQIHDCGSATPTTITGVVTDPAGKNPLYDVVVYVPNAPVAPLTVGASCDSCDALYTGSPIAATLTDAAGRFTLTKAPDGKDIPLVVQIGKWRKQITIPSVARCAETALGANVALPKSRAEGDIPSIAISTGDSDSLECLLRRVGIDASEYGGGPSGPGRIHIFAGGLRAIQLAGYYPNNGVKNTSPPGPTSSSGLWDSKADLMPYDIVLLSCEGGETTQMNQEALAEYTNAGGRVFASHFHYAWFDSGPLSSANVASWSPGTNVLGDVQASIVTTFPKGLAFSQWLGNVGALASGSLPVKQAMHNADVGAANVGSQAWIEAPSGATEYFTFNTPVGAKPAAQCGRVVYSDLHVGAASGDYLGGAGTTMTVPTGCSTADLSPQEKALEFMLFDLSSCVTPDAVAPAPPPVVH